MNKSSITSYAIEYLADYHPYGQLLRSWQSTSTREKYLSTQHQRDISSGLDYRNARFSDPETGIFYGVDPLADLPHNAPLSPYHYVANNPINNIDPDGRDWYQNTDGEQVWINKRDASYIDADGVTWSNIGEERLYFGGKNLIYYTQSEDAEGNLILHTQVFEAVSGKDRNGFDYSPENQAVKGIGPIPEGDYSINPQLIQNYSDLSIQQKIASWVGKGQWPGGRYSWGEHRVWISPSSVEVTNPSTGEKVIRDNMSIHGGDVPGSSGCIGLHENAPLFFDSLFKSEQTKIILRVSYVQSKKHKK